MEIKVNLLTALTIIVMIVSLIIGTSLYTTQVINQCTSNPLIYTAKYMEEKFNYKFVGTGYFTEPKYKNGIEQSTPIVTWDVDGINFQYPN